MKKKFNYTQFKIGDTVEVYKVIQRNSDGTDYVPVRYHDLPDGEELLVDQNPYRDGIITGVKNMKLGVTKFDPDSGYYFDTTGSITVWLVKFGLAGLEHKVLPQDLVLRKPLKKFPISSQRWSDRDKQMMREIMISVSRDAKGRWISI